MRRALLEERAQAFLALGARPVGGNASCGLFGALRGAGELLGGAGGFGASREQLGEHTLDGWAGLAANLKRLFGSGLPILLGIMGPWTHGDRSKTFAGDVDFGTAATIAHTMRSDLLSKRRPK